MKGKDLKYLSRKELIEVLYEMKKREIALKAELEETKAKLESKEVKLKEAGDIANAALVMNKVFESVQAAAADYLAMVKATYPLPESEEQKQEDTEEEAFKEISEGNPVKEQEESKENTAEEIKSLPEEETKPEEPKKKHKYFWQK